MPSSYYDIDAILAAEELVPCTTLFDFAHLGHLDVENFTPDKHYLPEKSRIKMPLWAIQKWATLGYVRLSLPRHFSRKARERLEADPSDADLRKRNERYFMSGLLLVNLMERFTEVMASSSDRRNRNANAAVVAQVTQEAQELRKTLLVTYMGERFRRILDWSFSSVGDDVSSFTSKLTEMECRLFERGAWAAKAFWHWKTFGNRRIPVARVAAATAMIEHTSDHQSADSSSKHRSVTPGQADNRFNSSRAQNNNKRRRVT